MLFRLDAGSGHPLYEQIVDQVRRGVATGTLQPGDRLPTVRELARDLVINPNTVARAYQDLERQGVVETRPGLGMFIGEPMTGLSIHDRRNLLGERLDRALVEAMHLNLGPEDVREILEERIVGFWTTGATLVKP
jgi:GntR family transcriptional regulator